MLRQYVFPVQFIFGILGNMMILLVLNSRGMKTKTNLFLSAMAVADFSFFVVRFPEYLRVFDVVTQSYDFMVVFVVTFPTQLAFANVFSAASIW